MEEAPTKSKFKDERGAYLTQSLFLEVGYDTEKAVYTFSDEDKCYKGKVYPSLRRLYLEAGDPTEYEFARTWLHGWDHWLRILGNKALLAQVELWREELGVKLRSEGVRRALAHGLDSFAAAKWAADGHWHVKRGRPSKEEQTREKRIRERVVNDTVADAERVTSIMKGKTA